MHDIDEKELRHLRMVKRYTGISILCAVFSLIYNFFSHGIHSHFMTFLFAWPLLLGALPSGLAALGFLLPAETASENQKDLWRFGIAAVTVASLLKGIMEIAGNDSVFTGYLMSAGAALLFIGGGRAVYSYLRQ